MNSRFSIVTAKPFPTRRPRVVLLSLLLLVVVTGSACDLTGSFVVIENRTSQNVQVLVINSNSGVVISSSEVMPGAKREFRGDCTGELSDIVIQDLDGHELIRHDGPLCADDSPWAITDEMISAND